MKTAKLPTALLAIAAFSLVGSVSIAQAPEPEKPGDRAVEAIKQLSADEAEVKRQKQAVHDAIREFLPVEAIRPAPGVRSSVATEGGGERGQSLNPGPIVTLDGQKKVPAGGFDVLVTAPANAVLHWDNDVPDDAGDPRRMRDEDGNLLLVYFNPIPGRYVFRVTAQVPADGLDPLGKATHVVTVGGPRPEPDVDPDVEPDPPKPDDKAPFPADGLHVLIVYESANNRQLTADQREIMGGADTRAFLDGVAPKRYRIYDQNSDLQFAPKVWQDAMAVPRTSLPYLVISNGTTGFQGPLDMTPAKFRELVSEHK